MKPDSTHIAFDGKHVKVAVERWGDVEREIVQHPGAVAVVAVDDEDHVMLVRQRREAARKALLELPAGTLEPGEKPLTTAKRELGEETGLHGGTWHEAAAFYSTPGICNERVFVYIAEGVERGRPHPDAGEELELVRVAADDLPALIGEIEDGKTLAGLLLFLRGR